LTAVVEDTFNFLARSQNCIKLRHVCPSVRMEQIGSHGTDFHEIWYLSIVREPFENIQVLLKSNKHNRYFT